MIKSTLVQDCGTPRKRLSHGFFGRQGGHSEGIFASLNCGLGSGDDPNLVTKNREEAARRLGATPTNLVTGYQIHSADCLAIDGSAVQRERQKADGFATKTPNVLLGILTADCAPVLFADPINHVVGAAHAGWRGAWTGIVESVISAMERLGAERNNICAAIGPCIAQASYEVGPEFVSRFTENESEHAIFFRPATRTDHALFDLPGFVAKKLEESGVAEIDRCDRQADTYGDPDRFFSYRRCCHKNEEDYGRHLSAIMIVD